MNSQVENEEVKRNTQDAYVEEDSKVLGRENLNPNEAHFLNRIAEIDHKLWTRSEQGGITTGYKQLDHALDNDISPGLYVIAGAQNTGKSALMLQIANQVSTLNKNVHCSYHALDDNMAEILIRCLANKARITISQAKNPARFRDEPDVLQRRNDGLREIYSNAERFSLWDSDDFSTLEGLDAHLKNLRMYYGDEVQPILYIDSIFDLETTENFSSDKQTLEYIIKKVKGWSTTYNAAVFTTAHIRKNGNKRPTMEDLKETNRLAFEANFAMLLYNEVGVNEEEASIFWIDAETDAMMPVLENRIGKNKFSSFKGTLYYEFMPDMSYLIEAEEEDRARYASMI